MSADLTNMLRMMGLLGDEGFVNALTNAEELVTDVEETLDRVERIESEAGEAVREANEALEAVDARLSKFDETMARLEAKIEAGFSIGFFFFAVNRWFAGDPFLAAGLFFMGLLGASSLLVTVLMMPQVKRLRQVGRYAVRQGQDSLSETDDGDDSSTEPPRTPRWETRPSTRKEDETGGTRRRDRRDDRRRD